MRAIGVAWGVVVLCALALGCGHRATFRTSYPDNQPEHIRLLLKRLPTPSSPTAPSNDTGQPMVVVALAKTPGLAAFNVTTGAELWRTPLQVDSLPFVGGPVVVVRSGQSIVGLSVRDGRRMWSRQAETIDFMGAAIDSGVVVLTYSTAGQRASMFREGRAQALDAETGRLLWSLGPVEKQFGAPAAVGGVVFIPWDRLTISAFDAHTGEEIARLLSRDDVYAFTQAGPEGVFYGSTGVYRLTERSSSGTREGSAVHEPLIANAPRATVFGPDGFLGAEGGRSARHKIRFLWRGAAGGDDEVSLHDNRAYFHYFRIVFAFEASTGQVQWAHQLPRDAEAAAAVPGGVLLLDGQGHLSGVSAEDGAVVHSVSLNVPVATAAFDVHSLPRGGRQEASERSVREQLLDIIFDPDTRLTPARRFAVSVLASIPDEEATRDLLSVCRHRRTPEPVRNDAAMVLRTRQSGARFLRAALDEHFDFLQGQEAPPVGVIASSVLHMEDSSAVPHLIEHLHDPETPLGELPQLAAALTALGDASMVPDLHRFLTRYRADSEFRAEPETLIEVARSIARHGSDEDRQTLGQLGEHPHTVPGLTAALPEVLAPAEEEEEGAPPPELRRTMSQEELDQVMEAARDRIRPCVQAAIRRDSELSDIRMTMVVSAEGALEELAVDPPDDILGSCLTLSLVDSTFPSSNIETQRVEYTIGIER